MDLIQKITQIIEPSLEALGYVIVQAKLAEGTRRKALIIMAERKDGQNMGFDDCTEISRTASALLEVEDPIVDAYDLEVCSPGLDRPLTRLVDFTRYVGLEAKIETMVPQDGRKRFRGIIKGEKNAQITLSMPEGEVQIAFDNIRAAKLVPELSMGAAKKPAPAKKKKRFA